MIYSIFGKDIAMSAMQARGAGEMFQARYKRILLRLARHLHEKGDAKGAEACRTVAHDADMLADFKDSSTAAYATSLGIEVYVAGEQSRPFLDFLKHLIDNETFRKFGDWILEHADEILKIVMTIIGLF